MTAGGGTRSYKRRQWIVNPPFQYRFIGILLLVLFMLTVGALFSVYMALWTTLKTYGLTEDPLAVSLLTTVGLVATLELLLIAPVVILIGVRLTHKIAGPLVRINAALLKLAQGDYGVHITLRRGDSLVEVAEAVNRLATALRTRR